ncbi:hypothetical protein VAR608DRAFT_0922 [Variovorax sp. HW608]|uniref:SRPBCC family protein n=1 Tax=Variovorax sp. HW608 TaxID=1034889 RepID=UPI00081FDB5C|nr:carbon monoxide dehydrogenase subunit G [Variovorax sp. HW608]SCK14724.1 hypothetical protein VAR608DRAFT_0922 [Variovorax sp. HW608]
MQITGSQAISMSPQDVWAALNDPEVLGCCVPGCESVERVSDGRFKLVMVSSIGPLRARFDGMLQMTEIQPAQSCVLVFEGQGGAIGFGKGRAEVRLLDRQGHTELRYAAEAQVGGKLAQVGSRLIDSVARKMSDDFFRAFREKATPRAAVEAESPVVPELVPMELPAWAWCVLFAGAAITLLMLIR